VPPVLLPVLISKLASLEHPAIMVVMATRVIRVLCILVGFRKAKIYQEERI
jgi:hypothetical protein